jgi:hypothetical protein
MTNDEYKNFSKVFQRIFFLSLSHKLSKKMKPMFSAAASALLLLALTVSANTVLLSEEFTAEARLDFVEKLPGASELRAPKGKMFSGYIPVDGEGRGEFDL